MPLTERIKSLLGKPNTLTLFRIFAVPLIVGLMYIPNRLTCLLAGLVFSAAAITDYLDGHLARQKDMVTNLGKVMDPLADKLLISSTLIMLAALGWVPAWAVCVIIGRELAVTGLRSIILRTNWICPRRGLGNTKPVFRSPQ
jgi:CDP-diacylglycerol--glycerol-3-phosphate 3-phosphatidyltransferase